MKDPVSLWHEVVEKREMTLLDELIDDACVFLSPVMHTPQEGGELTKMYLSAAARTLGNETFHYTREVIGERDAVLEFECVVDGMQVNGVDMLHWNDEGCVTEFKVMLRPKKALDAVQMAMMKSLAGG